MTSNNTWILITVFGGLIGYAVGNIKTGLPQWQYVFLIFGGISVLSGIISFFVLPDVPATARFLTPKERTIATERVRYSNNKTSSTLVAHRFHFRWRATDQG